MKFLVPNYSCLQNPWLGGYRPQIPVLSVLNWIFWTSSTHKKKNKIPGYTTGQASCDFCKDENVISPQIDYTYFEWPDEMKHIYTWNDKRQSDC